MFFFKYRYDSLTYFLELEDGMVSNCLLCGQHVCDSWSSDCCSILCVNCTNDVLKRDAIVADCLCFFKLWTVVVAAKKKLARARYKRVTSEKAHKSYLNYVLCLRVNWQKRSLHSPQPTKSAMNLFASSSAHHQSLNISWEEPHTISLYVTHILKFTHCRNLKIFRRETYHSRFQPFLRITLKLKG